MIWFWLPLACEEPPLLDRVATAYGDDLVASSETALGLFVSTAAVIAEPCAAENVDAYALVGEGFHAFRVTIPVVTVEENGERTYAYGVVAFNGDSGELTLTSDAARHAWSARYTGAQGSFLANYAASECEVDEAGVTTLSSLAGTGTYTLTDGTEQSIAISGGSEANLEWAPATSSVPTAGAVTWQITADKEEIVLEDASAIDTITRAWPGEAAGSGWSAGVDIALP
ncbi:hypothetical protein LBMAG42_19210 [Deltaproteobacteria bacterium]|nr:hypothetical protein LBMAG42_19210 [Deltaproteobacteria bacterium]